MHFGCLVALLCLFLLRPGSVVGRVLINELAFFRDGSFSHGQGRNLSWGVNETTTFAATRAATRPNQTPD